MKKFRTIIIMMILVLVCMAIYPSVIVLAEETLTQEQVDEYFEKGGYAIRKSDMSDENLYAYLLDEAANAGYSGNTLYSTMFDNEYFQLVHLNLSNKNISSLEGLEHLKLTKLETIDMSHNNLTTFDVSYFTKADKSKIRSMNFANNKISVADLTAFTGLYYVNFSSNMLSKVDLSGVTSSSIQIELANNKFSSISDINLPLRIDSIGLNIISNNITDISDEYFSLSKLTMNIGVQGIKQDNLVIDTEETLKFYKTNIENCIMKIYDISSLSYPVVKTISDNDIVGNSLDVTLPIGKYEIRYYIGENEAYDQFDYNKAYFVGNKLDVIPAKPHYEYEYRGERTKTLGKVTGKVKVHLTAEEGAVVYYRVNGGDWIEGTTIDCDSGGTYSIIAKSVKSGVESQEQSIYVKTSLNTVVSDGLMFILLLFFALVLFLVIVPLISKKFFKK